LRIEILKQADGGGLLRCTRRDGSVTWQKQANHAAHFALHDLTHYAAERAELFRRWRATAAGETLELEFEG